RQRQELISSRARPRARFRWTGSGSRLWTESVHGREFADVGQREADRLAVADEHHVFGIGLRIGPVPRSGARGAAQNAFALVIAQGLHAGAAALGQFSDAHKTILDDFAQVADSPSHALAIEKLEQRDGRLAREPSPELELAHAERLRGGLATG